MLNRETTICAIATPPGIGAISVIRITGPETFTICNRLIKTSRYIHEYPSHTIHLHKIYDKDTILDEVLLSIFKAPNSYTGEDVIEISCHGSLYIQQRILELLIEHGAVLAQPGEFTLRAFLNGKIDLSQAEAVADLIQSTSRTGHHAAIHQLRGNFSKKLQQLRDQLTQYASLLELELDFSEEDVEFADREQLKKQLLAIIHEFTYLTNSFHYGNAIKNGIPVAIIGHPNVGKSTFLNALLNEDKALVSDIPGTTRDVIEDKIVIEGYIFRFIDTAGIRQTSDTIESMGIERTFDNVKKASIIMYVTEPTEDVLAVVQSLKTLKLNKEQKLAIIVNKIDKYNDERLQIFVNSLADNMNIIFPILQISAKKRVHFDEVQKFLLSCFKEIVLHENNIIVTNVRHYQALKNSLEAANRLLAGIDNGLSTDLLAEELRQILFHMEDILGTITTEDVLHNIFKNFCIGK